MAITLRTITGDVANLLGADLSAPTKVRVIVSTNLPAGEAPVDKANNKILLGTGTYTPGADGTFSIAGFVDSTNTNIDVNPNPATLQYRIRIEYTDDGLRQRATWDSGLFSVTANADLSDIIAEQYVPPTWITTATTLLQGYVDEARAVAELDTSDALFASRIEAIDSETRAALDAGYFKVREGVAQLVSPGATTDGAPLIQAAIDAGATRIIIDGDAPFLLNSPIFDDYAATDRPIHIELTTVACLKLGSGLPTSDQFADDTTVKWAFFPGTLRTAFDAGTNKVTVSSATTSVTDGTNALGQAPRLRISGGLIDGGQLNAGVAFGNGCAIEFADLITRDLKFGLTWTGYADMQRAINIEMRRPATGVGAIPNAWLIYQITNGDGIRGSNIKTAGNCGIHRAKYCNGALFDGIVGGAFDYAFSTNIVLEAGHTEILDRSTIVKPSIKVNCSQVTLRDFFVMPGIGSTNKFLEIADDSTQPNYFSDVLLDRVTSVQFPATADQARQPDILISSFALSSRLRGRGCSGVTYTSTQRIPDTGIWVSSTVTAVAAALNRPGETRPSPAIAGDFWELVKRGTSDAFVLQGAMPGVAAHPKQGAPNFISTSASSFCTGTLSNGTTYEYVMAVRDADGRYSALSSTQSRTAGTSGTVGLTFSVQAGPTSLCIWRKTGTGVTSSPDRYIELPIQGGRFAFFDTGTRVNGRAWETTSLPAPSTVATGGTATDRLRIADGAIETLVGAGNPNDAAIVAPAGSEFIRTDGIPGAQRYTKQTGSGGTGWGKPTTRKVTSVTTATYTSVSDDDVLVFSGSAAAATLATPYTSGKVLELKNAGTAPVVITPASGAIDGAATLTLFALVSAVLVWDGSTWVRIDGAALVDRAVPDRAAGLVSGQWYLWPKHINGSTSNALGLDTLRVAQVIVKRRTSIDRLSVHVTGAGSTGALFRPAILADDGTNYPGALVLDPGTVAADSTGLKELTLGSTLILEPGIYWWGGAVQGAPASQPTIATAQNQQPDGPMRVGATSASATQVVFGYSMTGVSGALPGSFSTTVAVAGSIPRLSWRAA